MAVSITIAAQVENFKDRGVDIEQAAAQHGVNFASLDGKVQATFVAVAQNAWYAGGEAYL